MEYLKLQEVKPNLEKVTFRILCELSSLAGVRFFIHPTKIATYKDGKVILATDFEGIEEHFVVNERSISPILPQGITKFKAGDNVKVIKNGGNCSDFTWLVKNLKGDGVYYMENWGELIYTISTEYAICIYQYAEKREYVYPLELNGKLMGYVYECALALAETKDCSEEALREELENILNELEEYEARTTKYKVNIGKYVVNDEVYGRKYKELELRANQAVFILTSSLLTDDSNNITYLTKSMTIIKEEIRKIEEWFSKVILKENLTGDETFLITFKKDNGEKREYIIIPSDVSRKYHLKREFSFQRNRFNSIEHAFNWVRYIQDTQGFKSVSIKVVG